MEDPVNEIVKRTQRYWYVDGISDIGAGTFDNSVHSNDGVDVKGSQTFGSGTGTPVLQLNIDVGMGEVTVRT